MLRLLQIIPIQVILDVLGVISTDGVASRPKSPWYQGVHGFLHPSLTRFSDIMVLVCLVIEAFQLASQNSAKEGHSLFHQKVTTVGKSAVIWDIDEFLVFPGKRHAMRVLSFESEMM